MAVPVGKLENRVHGVAAPPATEKCERPRWVGSLPPGGRRSLKGGREPGRHEVLARSNHGQRRSRLVSKLPNQGRQIHASLDLSLCRLVVQLVILGRAGRAMMRRITHPLVPTGRTIRALLMALILAALMGLAWRLSDVLLLQFGAILVVAALHAVATQLPGRSP
jgi:hypothetical protein